MDIITGWYLANSDLLILDEVCKSISVISPVGFYEMPIPLRLGSIDLIIVLYGLCIHT